MPVLAALGISTPEDDLPLDRIPSPNDYNSGNVVPMGAHFIIERFACNATTISDSGTYVRLVLNEAVIPFTGCQMDPASLARSPTTRSWCTDSLPDTISTCGFNASYPQNLDFWWNYNTTKAYSFETQTVIPEEESIDVPGDGGLGGRPLST